MVILKQNVGSTCIELLDSTKLELMFMVYILVLVVIISATSTLTVSADHP